MFVSFSCLLHWIYFHLNMVCEFMDIHIFMRRKKRQNILRRIFLRTLDVVLACQATASKILYLLTKSENHEMQAHLSDLFSVFSRTVRSTNLNNQQ